MVIIKAEDLRIGNYVNFLGKEKQVLGVSKCNYNMGTETAGYYIEFKDHIPVNFIHIKPIPLDEKIVFSLSNSGRFFYKKKVYISVIYMHDVFICRKTGARLKYLHQLQNLYHALTGKELTIKQ